MDMRLHICILVLLLGTACSKSSFLDAKPNARTIIPSTVKHYQAILDEYYTMNFASPPLIELSSDDYYFLRGYLNSIDEGYRNAYLWKDDIWRESISPNWNSPYNIVFTSNLVLDGLNAIGDDKSEAFNNAYGSALFFKSFYYYQLAQVFTPFYNKSEAGSKWGLPIRVGVDINESVQRTRLDKTYEIILNDLHKASLLLPTNPKSVTRPSKNSCFALLARIYNQMQSYDSAYKYADMSLDVKDSLLDFNSDLITPFNKEMIWYATANGYNLPLYNYASASADSNLIKLYSSNDLRLVKFFFSNDLGGHYFGGNYDFLGGIFVGLATDEMYLIRSEAGVRTNRIEQSLADINTLLRMRYKNDGSWSPIDLTSKEELLELILKERRKELCFRGIRRSDLPRYENEGKQIMISRRDDEGIIYNIRSNDLRFIFLLPPDVISFNPDMPQNER